MRVVCACDNCTVTLERRPHESYIATRGFDVRHAARGGAVVGAACEQRETLHSTQIWFPRRRGTQIRCGQTLTACGRRDGLMRVPDPKTQVGALADRY